MNTLIELEKKINSELTTKINSSEIKHNHLYINIDKEDLTFFIGEDYFGQDYCEDDDVGLCVWLSKKLGKIDLIFQ